MKSTVTVVLSLGCSAALAFMASTVAKTPSMNVAAKHPKVLSPAQFAGKPDAIEGYGAAEKCPEICAKLFCYCGCDDTDGHKSLLDCFTSDHGSDCTVCTGQAVMALQMKRAGKSIAGIQKCEDLTFSKLYLLPKQTPALMRYRRNRLWKPTQAEALKEHPVPNPHVEDILSGA